MAIATLVLCYDNHAVFLRNVKIPQEETLRIARIIDKYGLAGVHSLFYHYLNEIIKKVPFNDPNRNKMINIITQSRSIIEKSPVKFMPLSEAKL